MARKLKHNDLKSAIDIQHSRLDRFALALADFLGSIGFLGSCLVSLCIYILWNLNLLPLVRAFDPYPFNGLDSVLSIFAIVLSVCVLISQNRQRKIEKIREQVEFEINIKAETEITKILEMLHDIQKKMGIDKKDPELEEMKETTDIEQLHRHIDPNITE
ncbi:MAG TPA: DUF1003 domain-containing protein [Mucilaginibacter sp.]|jgi:uncharacterized membrane protein|nr:DUF1003 domain-containing protein [Mucilaginibacter sp.]